jgi:hypothetical protein
MAVSVSTSDSEELLVQNLLVLILRFAVAEPECSKGKTFCQICENKSDIAYPGRSR